MGLEIRFTRSARKHRIGRHRVRQAVLADDRVLLVRNNTSAGRIVFVIVAPDETGRLLEVGFIHERPTGITVIHAMDARQRFAVIHATRSRA